MNNSDPSGNKAKGGYARADSLTPKQRSGIAKKAASARWDGDLPTAGYEGEFSLGGRPVACAILPNGKRLITQATFLRALGRSARPKAGTGVLSTVDSIPFFLQAEMLKPFISNDLLESTTPIFYRNKSGAKGVGYDARLLPQVAEVYLKYRDAQLSTKGSLYKRYEHIIRASDILMRALANVGIIALVDEATGYQRDRAKNALQQILEKFIAKELRPWVHTFPDEFYEQLYRLRGLQFPGDTIKRPSYFGHLTNSIVYDRLAPKVLEELKRLTPRNLEGRHTQHLHRRLSGDVGHPKLREHLASVVSLMKISDNYIQFKKYLDRAHPKFNETMLLPFPEGEMETGLGL